MWFLLFFAFFFPAIVDGTLTLVGQGPEYWRSGVVNEASPAYYFLIISPWLFIAGSVAGFVFWYWVFKKLKEPISLFLAILFIAGHSWGSASWIWNIARRNGFYTSSDLSSVILIWIFVIVYFVLISLFATYSLRLYMRQKIGN